GRWGSAPRFGPTDVRGGVVDRGPGRLDREGGGVRDGGVGRRRPRALTGGTARTWAPVSPRPGVVAMGFLANMVAATRATLSRPEYLAGLPTAMRGAKRSLREVVAGA